MESNRIGGSCVKGLVEIWRELQVYVDWLIDFGRLGETSILVLLLEARTVGSMYLYIGRHIQKL